MSLQTPSPFVPGLQGPAVLPADTLVFAFRERRLLVRTAGQGAAPLRLAELEALAAGQPALAPRRRQYLGSLAGRAILSCELESGAEEPEGYALRGLRSLYEALEESHFWLAARAVQIVAWDRDHQFCGRCGGPTRNHESERAKVCDICALSCYPRLAPAVIVLVRRGDEILLARSPHFPPGMYSTLAGFVEPGESLEETVVREIKEEVGVDIDPRPGRLRYFGSQPWPFPHSLMIGFNAEYAGGVLSPAEEEIEDAGWFTADQLPRIPPRLSIARALIDAFLATR